MDVWCSPASPRPRSAPPQEIGASVHPQMLIPIHGYLPLSTAPFAICTQCLTCAGKRNPFHSKVPTCDCSHSLGNSASGVLTRQAAAPIHSCSNRRFSWSQCFSQTFKSGVGISLHWYLGSMYFFCCNTSEKGEKRTSWLRPSLPTLAQANTPLPNPRSKRCATRSRYRLPGKNFFPRKSTRTRYLFLFLSRDFLPTIPNVR
mmetsp:Transcript_10244/g.62602  ORF Transcript_10244/g.62602 Transcript_10244/m.62602 type:complete len:202 (+) Transcript_10244:1433-2038(+)